MNESDFSIILLPTLNCNADCDYCFERRTDRRLSLDALGLCIDKVIDFLEQQQIGRLSLYWQGGEVMTLPPHWFDQADAIIRRRAERRKVEVVQYLQSNLIGYDTSWNGVLRRVFGNRVGSSMDFPNLHRRLKHGGPDDYATLWRRKVSEARDAGVEVSVIAIPNEQTLQLGAKRFYAHFADDLGLTGFQVNTPFAGGPSNRVKEGYPLDPARLGRFLRDLATVWVERGFGKGVQVGPFDRLLEYFVHGHKNLLCLWQDNCAHDFICIDPQGHVSQCDCWAASYPEFRFGNIFGGDDLATLLRHSEARRRLRERPGVLVQHEDCIDCRYLGICHGGCPVRAYTTYGELNRKDPYCPAYRALFERMEMIAATGYGRDNRERPAREGAKQEDGNPAGEKHIYSISYTFQQGESDEHKLQGAPRQS